MKTIILSFDMEPDIGSWTSECRGVKCATPEILAVLREHGVRATFLFIGREAQAYPRIVSKAMANGHEVGCHTMYHETVGEPVYDVPVGGFILAEEIPARLAKATQVVERISGARPVSFRAPRLFGSNAMIRVLEDLGYRVDSSFPAYCYGRDFLPYHPSRSDWSKPGRMRILELPNFYDRDADEDRQGKGRSRDQWPMLRLKGAQWFARLCRRMMARVKTPAGDSVLCVYLHPWEFVAMPHSVRSDETTITFRPFLYENTGKPALRALDEFLGLMQDDGIRFTTMNALSKEC